MNRAGFLETSENPDRFMVAYESRLRGS
jgi:hypothetical protein